MIPLAPKFRARGFHWHVIQREGDIAIVEQHKEPWTNPVLNVVIVQKHRERTIGGNRIPAAEGLPSWEQWGDLAWTCSDKEDAKKRFNALVDAANAGSATDVVANQASEGPEGTTTPPKSS